jgi:peptide/nickel transport system ATP-binding protein
MTPALLAGVGLTRRYGSPRRRVTALDDVTVALAQGASVGLVGESGSGKTTLGRILCALEPPDEGVVRFEGQPIDTRDRRSWNAYRRGVQLVFQDPLTALNPHFRAGSAIEAAMTGLSRRPRSERRRRVEVLAEQVGLTPELFGRLPHELSGGQVQRVVIARALAVQPRLLVLDEPVSALDVSIQAQILSLLKKLRAELGLTYLFISHDLAVVEQLCEEIIVMKRGRVVETGATEDVLRAPTQRYTRELIAAVPIPSSCHKPKSAVELSPT